jgi:cytochrome c-type biogenesis protein
MTENVGLLVAFGGGVLSFLSPCVLPMVPVYLSSLYGPELFDKKGIKLPLLLHSLSFVIGFSVVFVLLGALVGITGYAVSLNFSLLSTIAGWLLIAFGVFMLAALKVPWLNYERRLHVSTGTRTGYLRSFLIGAVFSFSWTACVGPILGGILAIASVQATAWHGAALLAVYSLGLGLPFLALGIAFDWLLPLLRRIQRHARVISVVSGLLLIAVGIMILTNSLYWFAALGG